MGDEFNSLIYTYLAVASEEVMHEFWWNRPSGEALLIEEVFGAKGEWMANIPSDVP